MKLLTKALQDKLIANFRANENGDSIDHKPVVKFFNPTGAATWLLTELDPSCNVLFGLCDLGMGCPELGYVSLDELAQFRGRFGLGIERDMHFEASKTISEYATKASLDGLIRA